MVFPAIIAVVQVTWRPCVGNQKKRQHSPVLAWPVPLLPNRCDSHSRCSSVFPKCEPWQLKCRDDISWTSTTTTPTTGNHLLPGLDTTIANSHQASSPAAATAATTATAAAAAAVKAGNNITTVNSIDSKSYSFSLKISIGICDKWLEALVDTGSTVSLIEEDVTGNVVKINNHITLKTAGKGDGLFSNSKVNQQFVIGNKIFEHEFLVVKSLHLSPISLILGYDLISKFKFVIKAQENTQIFVDDLVIPTIASNSYTVNIIASERERQTFLINNTEINVPANSAYCVSLKLVGREMQNGTKVAVIPTQEFSGVLNSDTLAEVCDGFITTLIYNSASQPITYKINSTFAWREPVTLTERIAALSVCADHDQRVQHLVAALTPPECLPFMRDIAATYASAFVVEDSEPTGYTEVMPFSIVTNEARPVKLRPYRVPVCQQDEVSQQLARMEEQGVISLSKSPWASPMVVVKKKDGSLRLCVDYRKLNSLSIGDSFPLPSIEELLITVSRSKYFSTLDLKAGYHQVHLDSETKHKTAFCVGDQLYEFNRLPFGLKNAPSHFSRLMVAILANLINSSVLVYLDDLIILGATPQEHADNLIRVIDVLSKHNLKINFKKCSFFRTSVDFLGHKVGSQGIKPLFDKVQAIKDFSRPQNPKEVSSFLGLVGYYRKFIKDFAKISRPLDALRKAEKLEWTPEATAAFEELRQKLTEEDILVYPKFDRPFLVTCDASGTALGGVVSQLDDQGRERPVTFCSRALKGAEKNYSALDREALAIRFVISRNRYFLFGYHIKIMSDHQPL